MSKIKLPKIDYESLAEDQFLAALEHRGIKTQRFFPRKKKKKPKK